MQDVQNYPEHPSPSEIIRVLRPMPKLAQQAYAETNFVGRRVHWSTRFFALIDEVAVIGKYNLSFLPRRTLRRGDIYADIIPGRFPELEMLQRGMRVELYGSIARVSELHGVTLALDSAVVLPFTFLDRLIHRAERT